MTDTIDNSPPELAALAHKAARLTDRAIDAYEGGKPERALRLAREAVASAATTHIDAARLVELLRVLGKADESSALAGETLGRIDFAVQSAPDDAALLFDCGHVCMELGRRDRAEPLLLRAHALNPSDGRAAILLMVVLLERGEPDRLIPIFDEFVATTERKGAFLLMLCKALGQYGFRDHAERVLATAEPHFAGDRLPYDEAMAAIRGTESGRSQREVATRLFDDFAANYDENLRNIGNNGPEMIARMLGTIGLKPGAGLEILDAGCGTGLCAPFLRPYAAHVHGCDVSVRMLELCREKRVYDLLTRTDLGMRATFPDGPFDLVASGDVFVYFGDLLPVLQNIASVLRPGGWLIFTVEDCPEDGLTQGYRVQPSGRHAHGAGYLARTLLKAGFGKPKLQFTDTLRTEFRTPVVGRAVAAQKLATLGMAAPGG
ncbi:methyltransferase domain-containing protein [Tropicimonas sp.]|uniref:methyltransferase domain-containing protein n=1 Tax=Tropicimonas sp. TaxID=2067044 RepID=UPI003A8925C6